MVEFLPQGESDDAALWLTSLDVFSPPFLRDEDQVKENVVLSLSLEMKWKCYLTLGRIEKQAATHVHVSTLLVHLL